MDVEHVREELRCERQESLALRSQVRQLTLQREIEHEKDLPRQAERRLVGLHVLSAHQANLTERNNLSFTSTSTSNATSTTHPSNHNSREEIVSNGKNDGNSNKARRKSFSDTNQSMGFREHKTATEDVEKDLQVINSKLLKLFFHFFKKYFYRFYTESRKGIE